MRESPALHQLGILILPDLFTHLVDELDQSRVPHFQLVIHRNLSLNQFTLSLNEFLSLLVLTLQAFWHIHLVKVVDPGYASNLDLKHLLITLSLLV